MMVANLQDALTLTGSLRVDMDQIPGQLSSMQEDGYIDFDITSLQGDIDYLVIDGTLPIEPTRNAETWMNMLQMINQTGLQMEYKSGKIVEEAIRAMGVTDIDQFRISETERKKGMTPSQQMAMLEKMRGVSTGQQQQPQGQETMSQEELLRQAEAGNIVPMRGEQ